MPRWSLRIACLVGALTFGGPAPAPARPANLESWVSCEYIQVLAHKPATKINPAKIRARRTAADGFSAACLVVLPTTHDAVSFILSF